MRRVGVCTATLLFTPSVASPLSSPSQPTVTAFVFFFLSSLLPALALSVMPSASSVLLQYSQFVDVGVCVRSFVRACVSEMMNE
jgi:hypothetical protein